MTNKQIARAVNIARVAPPPVDISILEGLATPEFPRQVITTIEVVALFLRWQCLQFNGGWDDEELNNLAPYLRKRVVVAD